jgi:hypothetical protein
METPCYIINSIIFIKGKSQKFTGDIFWQIDVFKTKTPNRLEGGLIFDISNILREQYIQPQH